MARTKLRQCREVPTRKSSTPNPLRCHGLRPLDRTQGHPESRPKQRLRRSTVGSAVLSGIILAAGDSTRMGSPKALLAASDDRIFVARIVRTWHTADVHDIVVVTGRDHDAVAAALARDAPAPFPLIARNMDPSRGQLSSLLVGF